MIAAIVNHFKIPILIVADRIVFTLVRSGVTLHREFERGVGVKGEDVEPGGRCVARGFLSHGATGISPGQHVRIGRVPHERDQQRYSKDYVFHGKPLCSRHSGAKIGYC